MATVGDRLALDAEQTRKLLYALERLDKNLKPFDGTMDERRDEAFRRLGAIEFLVGKAREAVGLPNHDTNISRIEEAYNATE